MNKPQCPNCKDDHYTFYGCCNGRECGCMGLPVEYSPCEKCNKDNDKKPSEYAMELINRMNGE